MALRRMISRRGKPRLIRGVNGTNFVGAERELGECHNRLNHTKISDTVTQDGIQWVFNPPSAPHFGGVWERMVRSAKKALKVTLNGQLVDDETLLTLATEVEGLLNSRPFTHVSCVDPNDPEPLTSNHILIGRGNPNLSPDVFGSNDRCSRKRCRQAQFLTDHFWKRWLREYVPSLTERRKWKRSQPNVKPGDVVLVIDENAPRCQWNLGRVPQTFLWGDGQIRVPKFKQNEGQ